MLAVAAGALMAARLPVTGDWDFFVTGSALLRGQHPLGLFAATHPQLQIGPLALIVAVPFTLIAGGSVLVKAAIFAGGLVCIRSAEAAGPAGTRFRLGGSGARHRTVVPSTVGFRCDLGPPGRRLGRGCGTCAAMVALSRNRSLSSGVVLGVAIAAKPWACPALPAPLAVPPGRRLRALLAALGIPVLVWLPFLIAAPGSLRALASFHIPLSASSGLHLLLGLPVGTAYPAWVRPLQFGWPSLASVLVARRGLWWAVPAVAFGLRLVLDPGSMTYYGAGLGAGSALHRLGNPWPPPSLPRRGLWRGASGLPRALPPCGGPGRAS